MKRLVRFFKCELTGEELAIIHNGIEEICVTADEGFDVYAEEHSPRQLVSDLY